MKKILACMLALVLLLSAALAEVSDGSRPVTVLAENGVSVGSLTLALSSNPTTGFMWTAFVVGGDSVELSENESTYVADPAPEMLVGGGGTQYFVLKAVKPGESIVRFTYGRSWEDQPAQDVYMLIVVEDDLLMYALDVTESGVYDGVVTSLTEDSCSVLLQTDRLGEVIAQFAPDTTLPVVGEHILLYTNGTMTMSEPAIVNVIAWESIPNELGRN